MFKSKKEEKYKVKTILFQFMISFFKIRNRNYTPRV